MEKRITGNAIEYIDQKSVLASVHFSKREGVIEVSSTFVDPSLRGQGIAGKLMEDVLGLAEKERLKIKSQCSYASAYFHSHPNPFFED